MKLDTPFGSLTRDLFYGDPVLNPGPESDNSTLIPNIAHVVWFGGGQIKFMFQLCVDSLLYVAQVEAVYIYYDVLPKGPRWTNIVSHPRVHPVQHSLVKNIWGNSVGFSPMEFKFSNSYSHMSDVMRGQLLAKYGGIYADTDVIWTKPLDQTVRSFEAVVNLDRAQKKPFPNMLNLGVALAKPNGKFFNQFLNSYKWFEDDHWLFNSNLLSYKIYEHNPFIVKIYPHLQVMCRYRYCFPSFRERIDIDSHTFNFIEETHSVHFIIYLR